MPKSKKVTVAGTGNVGSTIAFILAMNGLCHEVILRGRDVDVAKGKALDMSQAANAARQHTVVRAMEVPEDMADSDVVVITAGAPRTPGMSRDDLLLNNAQIQRKIVHDIAKYAPNAIIVTVSNPLDVMTYVALKESGFPKERVMGMAGILDSARMAHFIYEKLQFGAGQIRASVMGGHGDDMVPLPKFTTVAGVPIQDLLTDDEIAEIVMKTKNGGAEIVNLLGTSAYYAPAKSASLMVEAILRDTKQIHSCAVYLDGEFGYKDIVSGVPAMIGSNGVEKIVDEINLNEDQTARFARSVASVQSLMDVLYQNNFFGDN